MGTYLHVQLLTDDSQLFTHVQAKDYQKATKWCLYLKGYKYTASPRQRG